MSQSMRDFLQAWEKTYPDDLVRITEEVDPKYEITAYTKKFDLADRYPVLIFENVKGSRMPVAVNVEAVGKHLACALNVPEEQVEAVYEKAEEDVLTGRARFAPVEVPRPEAPCKEVVIEKEDVDLSKFPVVTHNLGEPPYLTRAIGVCRDPENGLLHAAYYRLMVKSKNHLVTHITPGRHLWNIYKKAEARGEPLPMAWCVGNHPLVSLGVQSRISHPPTEFDVVGALFGEPLRMVRCEHSDVWVPADTEIVIESELRPGALEMEGPWADFTRYSQTALRHSVFITGITHRRDPIYHDNGTYLKVHHHFNRVPQQVFVRREIKRMVPNVQDFRFGFFPAPMYGLITLDKKHPGEPKQAILAAFAAEIYLKYVFVFDPDIDLSSPRDIFWALATRCQADRDFVIIPGIFGTDLDISAPQEGVVTKVGFDCTGKPFRKDLFAEGRINQELLEKIDISRYLADKQK